MIFARGHRASYAAWEDAGAKGWNFDALLPYFKRTETAVGRDPARRGVAGPLIVKAADPLNELHAAGLAAAVQSGYRRASDISGGLEVGFGPVDLNIIDGQRQSAADAYLRPALDRPNLTLVTDAVVGRLVIERGRCIGVEYRIGNGNSTSHALAAEMVLTAGAIGSAQLLMSSGIGPQSHLAEAGIDVQLDLPGVGANLQDHAGAMIAYRAAHPVPPGRNNHGEVLGLVHSRTSVGAPDLQLIFSDTAASELVGVDGIGIGNGYAIGVCIVQPFSRGTVRLSPDTRPVIDPNCFGDDRDIQTMVTGVCESPEKSGEPACCTTGEARKCHLAQPPRASRRYAASCDAKPLPIPIWWEHARWAIRRCPWWTANCACTVSTDCASLTPL
jgi:choline dehydrogenase-like flavoprotein